MVAVGRKRSVFERVHGRGSARVVALHPTSLELIERLGRLCYRGNSRSLREVLGLELVADAAVRPGVVDVRADQAHGSV
jgi:hypothetical protein